MTPDHPLFSIITPCFNRAHLLREAIKSVLQQNYAHVEHIVVDGGSTDDTLRLLDEYPHLRVISEPDEGMYDAINKGLRVAQGRWIGLLNSDDLYAEAVLPKVAQQIEQQPEVEIIMGNATVFTTDEAGGHLTSETIANGQGRRFTFDAFQTGFQINACFLKRTLMDRIGLYNPNYRIVSDLDLLLRIALQQPRMHHLNCVLYHLRAHAGSLTFNQDLTALESRLHEEIQLWREWLRRADLPAAGRRYCQRQCGNACFTLTLWHASEGRWQQAMQRSWQGWQLASPQMARRTFELAQIKLGLR